jgi:FkbM family methyltransferase
VPGQRLSRRRLERTLGAASCVRESARFVFKELRNASGIGRYRLKGSGLWIHARQPLLDMWTIEETFRFRVYGPPAEAKARLDELGRPPRVVDLGGHIGCFGLFVRELFPGARVVSFEPDPGNGAILRETIEANRLGDRWSLIPACASTSDGTVEFASDYHLSRVIPAGGDDGLDEIHGVIDRVFPFMRGSPLMRPERREVESVDVFPKLAGADLVKMDIEGEEWKILADPRMSAVSAPVLVLEYHPQYCPEPDAEEMVTRALRGAGYQPGEPDRSGDAGLIWAVAGR